MRKHRFIGFVLAATTVAGPITLATTTHASASVALNLGMPAAWRLPTINVPISQSIAHRYAQMTRPIPAVPFSDVVAPAPLDLSNREVQQPSDEARFESVRLKQANLAFAAALRKLALVSTTAQQTEPAPVYAPAAAASGDVWAELRQCESGGNYAENTGNGFYGAYQFAASTWAGLGYPGLPNDAAPAVQDAAAATLEARSGWGQWPACSAQLGL